MKKVEGVDVVIIGGGIAGLFAALELPEEFNIVVLTKEKVEISNSSLAQGGIAVPMGKDDSPALHFSDTLYAGAGLCNPESVWVLVNEAIESIRCLCQYGIDFDKVKERLALTREAAHSKRRIIHSGDKTGKEICDSLARHAQERKNIKIYENMVAIDFIVFDDKSRGVVAADAKTGEMYRFEADSVICATGGIGQVYKYTSNPEVATGDGIAMGFRAGVVAMDMEFVQFHPTVLTHKENNSFLISEAVRGEGAVLRNDKGERFMHKYHELQELAPRDVVSRAIFSEMKEQGADNVWLDITFKDREWLQERFPQIFAKCKEIGLDISKDYIPVAPAAHYFMGGLKVDLFGNTNISGLYACGETGCTGVHGANRLASNSLLEGLVFSKRIVELIAASREEKAEMVETMRTKDLSGELRRTFESVKTSLNAKDITETTVQLSDIMEDAMCQNVIFGDLSLEKNEEILDIKKALKSVMNKKVAIVRQEKFLEEAKEEIKELEKKLYKIEVRNIDWIEVRNLLLIAGLIVGNAIKRTESRGSHYRSDFPETDELNWKRNIYVDKIGGIYE